MGAAEQQARVVRNIARNDGVQARGRPEGALPIVIELDDVWLELGGTPVLRGINLRAREGETLLVVGESGAGKSTILKLILRLLVPDRGRIVVFGREITALPFDQALGIRKQIGTVFQNAALFDSLSVFDNVAYPLRENTGFGEDEIETIVRRRLAFVDLDPDHVMDQLPAELSGGMKKRVGIARAIATHPKMVLYDEPTAGLDPLKIDTITDLIRKLQLELGVTSIVVSHDIRAGFKVASRVNLLRDGRIDFEGTPEDMVVQDDSYIRHFLS